MEQMQQQQLKELGSKLDAPPASKDALLKLLKHGVTCLSELDQSPPKLMLESMQPFLNAIVKPELLKHKDGEVKLFVAACICEITRITAPEAPYDDDTLKDIFQLIVSTFNGLSDINSSAFGWILVILETLARYRMCVVMLDLECDDLIDEMFNTFFSVIRDEHPDDVFTSMQTIMVVLLEESEGVPENLLLTLLSVLDRDNEDVTMAARRLAMNVVKRCAGKLNPGIKQFLVSSMSGDSKSLKSEINYHAVLHNIYRSAPQILSEPIPHLTEELLRPSVPSVEEETKILEAGLLTSESFQSDKQPSNVDKESIPCHCDVRRTRDRADVCKPTPSSQNDKPTSSLEFSGSISGILDLLHNVESHITRFENTTTCLDKSIEIFSRKFHSVEPHITHLENATTCLDKSAENLSRKFHSVESHITHLEKTTACLDKSAENLSRKFHSVESNITHMEKTTTCVDKSAENLSRKFHTVESNITRLEDTTSCLDKSVESLSRKFQIVESNITRLENTTTCLDKFVESLSRKIHSVESHITRLVNTTTCLDKSIENLSRKFQSVESNITRLENTTTCLDMSTSSLSRKFHSVETCLENTTTCLDKSVEKLTRKFQSVESNITCLEKTTASLDKSVDNLSQKLDSPPNPIQREPVLLGSSAGCAHHISDSPPPPDGTDFSVSSYDLEYRSSKDDAWYTVCLVLDTSAETLTIKYFCSPEMKAVFSAGHFMTGALLEELIGRFRPVSWELQDDECLGLSVGTSVCATYGIGDNDILFYDAIVEAVEHRPHSYDTGEEECLCTFMLSWQHGPGCGTSTPANISSIRVLESTSQIDPRLHAFGEIVNKKIASSKSKSAVPCLGKKSNGASNGKKKRCSYLKGVRIIRRPLVRT